MYVNVCMCAYIYIFCNVLMDGWNGMAWKGREGKGMVS